MTDRFLDGLRSLPASDKNLLKGFVGMAVLALGLGTIYGTMTAFTRADFVSLEPAMAYRMLTLHGVTIFFYWLYFAQAGLVLILACVYTEGAEGVMWRPLAWLGFGLMVVGFILSGLAPTFGVAALYNAPPELVQDTPTEAGFFYLGYVLLALGLFLVALSAIYTALKPKLDGKIQIWSAISFAAVAWAGMLMVTAMAALNAFLPSMLWAFGLRAADPHFIVDWSILFHNVHYLPLMATVVIWYVLVEVLAGVKSIFGQQFSKVVFSTYLIFVPPTSLYHMFLEPNMSEVVKVAGSLLSLFISVPTVLVFLIIVASLEATARARGARGLFGWIRMLPWSNPSMAAMGMAVVNLALGGVFSFVLIQDKIAPLLSDTFFVPGYFHFLTLGTVTLTFIAILMYVIPGLTGRALWRPELLSKLPYLTTFGLLIFGGAGITAGYMGVPRRVFDVNYEGAAPAMWGSLMTFVGIGAGFMALALAVYVYGLARTLIGQAREVGSDAVMPSTVSWNGTVVGRQRAWFGPLSILVLVGAMYAFTALAFEIMEGLSVGGQGAH